MPTLRIAELDFENIKRNLKDFLATYRDENNDVIFSDYEFEGSSLSIIIDLLAYNTHYNAFMANMLANELFLDSAVKRESAVSIAKHLGYTPRSTRSAKATITFEVEDPTDTPTTLTLPRYHPFSTTIDNISYTFVNIDPVSIESSNTKYIFNNVEITEGIPLEISYRALQPGPSEKYEIPNDNVDTTTVRVIVQNSYSDPASSLYTLTDDITEVSPSSNVFYIEENSMGKYEVFFGDGVLGRKLSSGNIIRIQYLVSNGSNCNVSSSIIQNFTSSREVDGGTILLPISTTVNSSGGASRETLESIKFNAPKFFATYNRAVTSNDYKALIYKSNPLIESVSVWGGDQNVPPKYGKVMISMKPYEGYVVSQSLKEQVARDILSAKNVMAITPEFVDPEYIWVGIDCRVRYDTNTTSAPGSSIRAIVDNTIRRYFEDNLQQFDNDFVYSRLTGLIDDSESAIIGNITRIHLQKRIRPTINIDNIYDYENIIKMNNPITRGSVRSTGFNTLFGGDIVLARIVDVPLSTASETGTIRLVSIDGGTVLVENYGTVNYMTGDITLSALYFVGYSAGASDIRINADPTNLDIQATNNQILVLDNSLQNTPIRRESGLLISVVGE